MSDTIIKGKKAIAAPEPEVPETQDEVIPEASTAGQIGFSEEEFKKQREQHFAGNIFMELIRTRAESGFFNRENLKGDQILVAELTHFRNVADVAAKAFYANK